MGEIKVIEPGILSSIQGEPRFGKRHFGISGGGAWDLDALRFANRILGNAQTALGIEMTLRGPSLEFSNDTWIACVGGRVELELPGFQMNTPVLNPAGRLVKFGYALTGIRTYLAILGGIDPKIAGFNLRSLTDFQIEDCDHKPSANPSSEVLDMEPRISMQKGPDFDVFGGKADTGLRVWLQPQSNRQAILLKAKNDLSHNVRSDYSRPLYPGFVQLLPDGQLAVIGPDGHTMGGYPRVGVLDEKNRSKLGRIRPGTKVEITIEKESD